MTDAELILRARGGDELAFRRLVDRHDGMLRGVASRYYLPGGADDDLYQEALWGFHKAIRDYRPERKGSFPSFARLCVQRQVMTAVKTANGNKHLVLTRRRDLSLPDAAGDGTIAEDCHAAFADHDADPLHRLVQQEDWDEIRRLCLSLSPLEGEALGLFLTDFTYDEIAERIGCSHKTVDNAMQRCRRKLSEGMAVAA